METAELIVRAGYDGAELTRGLAKSASEVEAFGREVVALGTKPIPLPAPAKDTTLQIGQAISMLKALGVELTELGRDASGSRVFSTLSRDAATAATIFAKMGAEAKILGNDIADVAVQLAKADAALRNRISLLSEGARLNSTQSASIKELQVIYGQLSREIATSNPPLERRIQLEQQLVRIRQQLAVANAASPASNFQNVMTARSDFSAGIMGTAKALETVRLKTEGATRSFALINRTTGEFTAAGRRASGAAIGVAFGLEALARGGTAAEGGLRTALRSVAAFAPFFGVKGLLVSGAAAGTAAIIDLFTKSRDEITKTTTVFNDKITEMVRNADVIGLMKELQNLEIGKATLDPQSGLYKLSGGLKQLTADRDKLQASLNRPFAHLGADAINADIASLNARILRLTDTADSLKQVITDLRQVRLPQLSPTVRVEGKKDADLASEAFKKLKEQVDSTVTSANQLGAAIVSTNTSAGLLVGNTAQSAKQLGENIVTQRKNAIELLALHDKVSKLLSEEKNKSGAAAVALREMLADMEKVGELQSLLRLRQFLFISTKIDPLQVRDALDDAVKTQEFFVPIVPVLGSGPAMILRLVKDLPNIEVPVTLKPQFDEFGLQNFKGLIQQIKDAQGLLDFAQISGDKGFQREQEADIERLQKRVENFARSIQVAMFLAKTPSEVVRKIMAEIVRLQKEIKGAADPEKDKFANQIIAVAAAGRGLLQTADGFDLISDRARQAASAVLDVVGAIGLLKKGDALSKLSGAIALIGGVTSLLNSIGVIGESPQEKERNQILRANNEELARLRLELRGFTNSIGQQLDLARNLDTLQPAINRFVGARPEFNVFGRLNVDAITAAYSDLMRQINALGFTLQELAIIAKQNGIDLLDAEGRLIPQAMADFAEKLRLGAAAAVRFGDSFDEAREGRSLLNRARGITEDTDRIIADNVALFKQFAPKLFEQFFGAVNFSDSTAVRAAIEKFLVAWLADTEDALAPLFKDLTPVEVRSIIDAWLTAFTKTADAANQLTDSLLNLPAAFKIERYRSAATMAWFNPNVARAPLPSPPITTTGTIGGPGFVPSGGGVATRTVGDTFNFGPGSIVVQERGPEALFTEIKKFTDSRKRAHGLYAKGADIFDV